MIWIAIGITCWNCRVPVLRISININRNNIYHIIFAIIYIFHQYSHACLLNNVGHKYWPDIFIEQSLSSVSNDHQYSTFLLRLWLEEDWPHWISDQRSFGPGEPSWRVTRVRGFPRIQSELRMIQGLFSYLSYSKMLVS